MMTLCHICIPQRLIHAGCNCENESHTLAMPSVHLWPFLHETHSFNFWLLIQASENRLCHIQKCLFFDNAPVLLLLRLVIGRCVSLRSEVHPCDASESFKEMFYVRWQRRCIFFRVLPWTVLLSQSAARGINLLFPCATFQIQHPLLDTTLQSFLALPCGTPLGRKRVGLSLRHLKTQRATCN